MGKLNINNGGVDTNKVMADIDERFGPYNSFDEANAALGGSGRNVIVAGLKVGIRQSDGSIKEYFYQPNGKGQLELVAATGIPEQGAANDKVLGYENGKVAWVEKPVDGADAYQVAVRNGFEGNESEWLEYIRGKSAREIYNATYNKNLNDAQFIAELKTSYPMLHVGYNASNAGETIGVPFTGNLDPSGDNIGASENTMGKLYLMPDDDSDPENCIGFVTVLDGSTYKWCNVGAISIPSDALAKSDVDNECTDGATDDPASAKVVMDLKAKLAGVTVSEVKADFTMGDGYINTLGDLTGTTTNAHAEIALSNGADSIRFLGLVLTSEASGNVANYSYSFYDENDTPVSPKKYNIVESVPSGTTASKEYIISIPDNAVKFMCSIGGNNRDNFYCYLQSGENVVDKINSSIDSATQPIKDDIDRIDGVIYIDGSNVSLGSQKNHYINPNTPNEWNTSGTYKHYEASVESGQRIKIVANSSYRARYAFLKSVPEYDYQQASTDPVDYAEGCTLCSVMKGEEDIVVVPDDANYIYIYDGQDHSNKPSKVTYVESVKDKCDENTEDIQSVNERVNNLCYYEQKLSTVSAKKCYINSNVWAPSNSTYKSGGAVVEPNSLITVYHENSALTYCVLSSYPDYNAIIKSSQGDEVRNPDYANGYNGVVTSNDSVTAINIPSDGYFLYLYYGTKNYPRTIDSVNNNEAIKDYFDLDKAETIFDYNDDEYMTPRLAAANHPTRSDSTMRTKPVVFAHISDCHGDNSITSTIDRWNDFVDFASYWRDKGYIDELVDTGDIVRGSFGNSIAWRERSTDVLTILGNHDTWNGSAGGWRANIGQNAYNKFLKGNVEFWDVVQPSNAEANGYCYYYKDYVRVQGESKNMLRAIYVDCMGFDETQYNWIKYVLQEVITGGIVKEEGTFGKENTAVVIFTHFPPVCWRTIPCSYSSKTSPSENYTPGQHGTTNPTDAYNTDFPYLARLVRDYQEDGGMFVGYVCGHYHYDAIGKCVGGYTYSKWDEQKTVWFDDPLYPQLVYAVSAGNVSHDLELTDYSMSDKNETRNAFQIIGVDVYGKNVRVVKIGCRTDRYLRRKDSIAVTFGNYTTFSASNDYSVNSKVVYEGKLYRFIAPHNSKAWDYADVVEDNRILE